MYIAPLNYDRFFKKIFSDIRIAKRFLEDFLEQTIEEIELLPLRHRVTDEAMVVEFDFRCKIKGRYIVIEMQQWFKTDVAKRFYLYHCLGTALQLEGLPTKSIPMGKDKKRVVRDYAKLEPVLTLIWMATDTLGSEESLLTYQTMPDMVQKLVENEQLWEEGNVAALKAERSRVLKTLGNQRRDMIFFGKNQLTFAFQKNIVKDKKYRKYVRWFLFAEKSCNPDNIKEDFDEFLNDEIFMEMIHRLVSDSLGADDIQYITEFGTHVEEFKQFYDSVLEEGEEIGLQKGEEIGLQKGEEIGLQKGEEIGLQKGEEIGLQKGEEIGLQKGREMFAENCLLKMGMSINQTAKATELPIEEVQKIAVRLGLLPPKSDSTGLR